ncbi:MAG TPA: POTRA domain-containing protein [Cyclobacteriaceae bacterium]|nr:POTRA domain-containing protein [Cyclobacteriaceae bacterium]
MMIKLSARIRNWSIFPSRIIIHLSFLILPGFAAGQVISNDSLPPDSLTIDHLFIIGNRVTREKIIRRELDFKEADKYERSVFESILKRNEEKLINTSLFLTVKISIIDLPDKMADIIVRVVERWYLFPIPIFELADRNFNDWWVNQNHDLSRIEWGLRLTQYNVRGMNETLRLTGQLGFTKRFYASYSFPYINRKQKTGLDIYFDYGLNKNISYETLDHKLHFIKSNRWLKEYFAGGLSLRLRKSFYSYHTWGINYLHNKVNDTIPQINPEYFSQGENEQQFLWLYYNFIHDKRDIASYPLHGSYFRAGFEKYGLGIFDDVNIFIISALYDKYFELPWKLYLDMGLGGRVTFPEKQPYNLTNSLGYGSYYLRGYELYVIQGRYFIQNKWTLRKLLFKRDADLSDYFTARQLQHFNIAIYLKTFADLGYVKNYENNPLNTLFTDQFLYGYGAGFDISTFYDMLFRLEYSFNKIGEHGFVFGIRKNF